MKPNESVEAANISRRTVLRHAMLVSGGGALVVAGLIALPAAAKATQLPPAAVGYQNKPMGRQRCDNCLQWQAPTSCKVVTGVLKPEGWCSLYSAKP